MKDQSISYARKRIEKQIEIQEAERKRRLQAQRLELARAGINAYQKKRFAEAVKQFTAYIKILEEIKEIPAGSLHPKYFDAKADASELLMISGVYWDLAKLFDRTRSPEKFREFVHYMDKYIVFSKGMDFQHLCAEALRKYLGGDKPIHREEFKNAYKVLSVDKCFIAAALSNELDIGTLIKLRDFRDTRLTQSKMGRHLISQYYRFGPDIALYIDRWPSTKKIRAAKALDFISKRVSPK